MARWVLSLTDLSVATRVSIALAPLLPSILHLRVTISWIRRLDEFQQQIQLEAWVIAAIGTVFLAMAISLLSSARVLNPYIFTWEGYFASMIFLHIVGTRTANMRFK